MNAPDPSATMFASPKSAPAPAPRAVPAGTIPLRQANDPDPAAAGRSIGSIIQEANQLDAEQVETILAHQREHGLRFGEAAVALGLVRDADVLWALSQQFQYPNALTRTQPLNAELVVATQPFSRQAEVFRTLRSQLSTRLARQNDAVPRAVAVVSAQHGDGRSYVASNLAIAFSQLGGRTLLVDADQRNPRQHALFGIDNRTGLSAILSGRESARVIHPVESLPSLYVLPVGTLPPNPIELVERQAFALLMRDLLAKFDHVIVDTPAASTGSDAGIIAARCGAALAVARRGRSHVRALEALVETLRAGPGLVLGATLNEH